MGKVSSIRKWTASQRRRRRIARKSAVWLIVAAVVAGLVAADRLGIFGRRQEPDSPRYNGRTFRVGHTVDGDTLDVNIPDGDHRRTRIRLRGVDTPECVRPNHPVEHFGPEAASFTRRMTRGKMVRLEIPPHETRDKYGRLLAYVYLDDGRMLNRLLIEKGMGYADPRFDHPHKREFLALQKEARKAERGLWAKPRPEQWPAYVPR
jgi:micrococcal nuclease